VSLNEQCLFAVIAHWFRVQTNNLKEMAASKQSNFWKKAQDIHERRCDADLLYALLMSPTREIKVDGQQMLLVDRILSAFFVIISKKNAPSFEDSRRIREARAFLTSEMADTDLKIFNVLMMLNREPELQDIVRSGFDMKSAYNLWGDECIYHFDAFLAHLNGMVEATLNWNYNETNIVDVVRNFVQAARLHYTMT